MANRKYDFDKVVDRRGTGCVKWDEPTPVPVDHPEDIIPMWVADMDFPAMPEITEALAERVRHGVFGYNIVPRKYYDSVVNWYGKRYGWKIDPSWIEYTTGIVPGMTVVIKALTDPGEKVLILTPAYNCFFSSTKNDERELVECPLIFDPQTRRHTIDFELFERQCSDPKVKLFLFCNPHNPSGRVWSVDELTKIGEICRRHGVIVASDEIHCEIVMPGHKFTPFASVSSENQACCVTMNAASKSFNIAGLQMGNIITSNPEWRKKINRVINVNEVCDVNAFGQIALEQAYTPAGAEWLKELNEYIYGNFKSMKELFGKWIPQCTVTELEGTYLAWVDVRPLGMPSVEIRNSLLQNEKVWINDGTMYGKDGFMRINLATPKALADEGFLRIVRGFRRILGETKGLKEAKG